MRGVTWRNVLKIGDGTHAYGERVGWVTSRKCASYPEIVTMGVEREWWEIARMI